MAQARCHRLAVVIEDPEKLLEEANKVVEREQFAMKRALDTDKMMDALKHASNMLCELRTSMLSPKTYYELFINITQQLRHLELHLTDQFEKKNPIKDLYELVQYAGNIVPRLYLLVTVGAVYVKTKQVTTKDIMKDLVEMTRGVQHPLRGLFLRSYLLQCLREHLPTEEISEDGTINDSVDFILLNFSEMNKLWVRMQHQGHTRDKEKRERERRELRLLVGKNFERLSSLENITVSMYKEKILPAVLEQVINCKDAIAQEYLMECIIQVFPDEYHLQTLTPFLEACGQLSALVNIRSVITSLIDRLALYALNSASSIPADLPLFEIFSDQVASIGRTRVDLPLEDMAALQAALVNLALKCYPNRKDYVDKVLENMNQVLTSRAIERVEAGSTLSKELGKLLKVVSEGYSSIEETLELRNYAGLYNYFSTDTRRDLATDLLERIIGNNMFLDNVDHVSTLLEIVQPLLADQPGVNAAQAEKEDAESFAAEQFLVARFLNCLRGDSPDTRFQILSLVRKHIGAGGNSRMKHTLPTLVFGALRLIGVFKGIKDSDEMWEKKIQKIFTFCHQSIGALAKAEQPMAALRLYLQGALTANATPYDKQESVAYEFMSQAFLLYEEDISDSKQQISALTMLIGTLENMTCFTEENYSPLLSKCTLQSTKLVKKPDQCRCAALCAHLFWSGKLVDAAEEKRDSKQTLACLQKAARVAAAVMEPPVQAQLSAELLSVFVLFYEKGVDTVTPAHLSKMISLIEETLAKVEGGEDVEGIRTLYNTTLQHIRRKKANPGNGPSYSDVALPR